MDLTRANEIEARVYQIIATESGIAWDQLGPDTTMEDLELSSIDKVMMFFEFENEFEVEFDQSRLNDLSTLQSLVDFIRETLRAR